MFATCVSQDEQRRILEDVGGDMAAARADLLKAQQEQQHAEALLEEMFVVLRTVGHCPAATLAYPQ